MSIPMTKLQTQLAAELAELDKKVAPPSGHRISLKGRMFTFPDGKTIPGPINAVILDWRHVNQFFKSAYNPQKVEAPSCFALSKELPGMKPSENCADPQSQECDSCAFFEWGSAPGGSRGKACKEGIRIAIVPPDATKDTPPRSIDLAPSSVTAFNNLVNTIRDQLGKLPLQVKVTIDFDPNADYPRLTFADPEPLPEELIEMMFDLRKASQSSLEKEPGT